MPIYHNNRGTLPSLWLVSYWETGCCNIRCAGGVAQTHSELIQLIEVSEAYMVSVAWFS